MLLLLLHNHMLLLLLLLYDHMLLLLLLRVTDVSRWSNSRR